MSDSFYEAGYTYRYPRYAEGYDWRFRVDVITTHPEDGSRTALGWRHFQGEWRPYAYEECDWDAHNFDPAGALIAELSHAHVDDGFEAGCPVCERDEVTLQDTGRPWRPREAP